MLIIITVFCKHEEKTSLGIRLCHEFEVTTVINRTLHQAS